MLQMTLHLVFQVRLQKKLLQPFLLTQVPENHFAFATAFLWHSSFEITLKLYLYGKYSIQTMIFWSLCAFIWFKNIEKMLLQMTSGFLQLESTILEIHKGTIFEEENK
jgi:hypothetical protein